MPYAEGRVFYDADSHLMETSDWLVSYADPDLRDRIRPLYLGGAGAMAEDAVRQADARRADGAALGETEDQLLTRKGWHAYGAFDPQERSRRAGPARIRPAARVLHVCADPVPGRRPRAALRRHARAQPRRWPSSAPATNGSSRWGSSRCRIRSSRRKRSTKRSRSAAARSWCRRIRPAPTRRRIPTSTPCGPGCRTPRCPSRCTSAAAGECCGRASTRTDDPGRPTFSAAVRTSARRTTWSCTIRPRCSSRRWFSTACSRSSRASCAA